MTRRDVIAAGAQIIRETVSARDYAERIGIQVNRAGLAHCPFHDGDHGASLKLYHGNRGWYCYGCHQHGDVIELAKRLYNLNYPQAIQQVAEDCGIDLPIPGREHNAKSKMSAALERARQQEEQRNREARLKDAIETRYWVAFDVWLQADRDVQELAIKERQTDEPYSDAFAQALMRRQEARLTLDYLTIRRDML